MEKENKSKKNIKKALAAAAVLSVVTMSGATADPIVPSDPIVPTPLPSPYKK